MADDPDLVELEPVPTPRYGFDPLGLGRRRSERQDDEVSIADVGMLTDFHPLALLGAGVAKLLGRVRGDSSDRLEPDPRLE